jgi:hypothetical protein
MFSNQPPKITNRAEQLVYEALSAHPSEFTDKTEQLVFETLLEQRQGSLIELYQEWGYTEAQIQEHLAKKGRPQFIEYFERVKEQQVGLIKIANALRKQGYTEEFIESSVYKIESITVKKEEILPLILKVGEKLQQVNKPTEVELLTLFEPYMNRKERWEQAIKQVTQEGIEAEQRADAMARERIAAEQRASAVEQEKQAAQRLAEVETQRADELERQLQEATKKERELEAKIKALLEKNTRNTEQSSVANSPRTDIHKKRNAGGQSEGNSHDEVQKSDSSPKKQKPEGTTEKLKEGFLSLFSHHSKQHSEKQNEQRNETKKGQDYSPKG